MLQKRFMSMVLLGVVCAFGVSTPSEALFLKKKKTSTTAEHKSSETKAPKKSFLKKGFSAVRGSLKSAVRKGVSCSRYCVDTKSSKGWESALSCIFAIKLHPKCLYAILREIHEIQEQIDPKDLFTPKAQRVKPKHPQNHTKGSFFQGFSSLSSDMRTYVVALIHRRLNKTDTLSKAGLPAGLVPTDIFKEEYEAFKKISDAHVPSAVWSQYKKSGKKYLAEILELGHGNYHAKVALAQVVHYNETGNAEVGTFVNVHVDQIKDVLDGTYIAFDSLIPYHKIHVNDLLPKKERFSEEEAKNWRPEEVYFFSLSVAKGPQFLKGHAKGHTPKITLTPGKSSLKKRSGSSGHHVYFAEPAAHHKGSVKMDEDEGFDGSFDAAVDAR